MTKNAEQFEAKVKHSHVQNALSKKCFCNLALKSNTCIDGSNDH